MDSNFKILDILIDTLGTQTIIDICQKRARFVPPLSLPDRIPGFAVAPIYQEHELAPCGRPTGTHAPMIPGMKPLCCERALMGSPPLNSTATNLSPPPVSLEVQTPPKEVPVAQEAPPAPKKVVVKVKVKKTKDTTVDVSKNLNNDLEAVKETAPKSSPLPPPPVAESSTVSQANTSSSTVPAKKVQVKKVISSGPRCEGRVYGEKVEMEGTKAPTGGPLHAYKVAQCDRQGKSRYAIAEDNTARKLADNEEQGESEGVANLCSICVKRYEARKEHPENWHGFFDMDTWPETSHFVGGSWYRGKMAKVSSTA